MKVVDLNIWGGRAGKQNLLNFFQHYQASVDVFCLQEVWSAPYFHLEGQPAGARFVRHDDIMVYGLQELTQLLPNFTPYFRPLHGDHYGLLMLIKKEWDVLEEGEYFVHKEKGYIPEGDVGLHARCIQYARIAKDGAEYCVVNFHGLWNGKGKTDSDDRLIQSRKIVRYFADRGFRRIIFCGDFNLLPTTQSLHILEDAGLVNLIAKFGITSTRTSYYTKDEKFADYVFIGDGIVVNDFRVLPEEVSDHAPLSLDCS